MFQTVGMSYYLYSTELPSAVLRIKTGPITFLTNSITGIASCYATPPLLLNLSLKAGFRAHVCPHVAVRARDER
jgi:SP family general alpha glucoside:H+ symporter-like MFS transporter